MTNPTSGAAPDPMQVLLDEAEIRRVLYRYVRGIDRHDPELVRSCYHADADDNHGNFSGTRDEFVAWAAEDTAQYAFTSHHLTNMIIEVCGDVALVETYALTANAGDTVAGTGKDFVGGFRYIDRFEKRDGVWGMVMRNNYVEWTSAVPALESPIGDVPDHYLNGVPSRDRDDPSYQRPLVNRRARNIPQ